VSLLDLDANTQVYHLPDWHSLSHPQRLAVIRQIAESRGRDPRIARLAVDIVRKKARPRDYKGQAAALLRWIQDPKNFYYVNEAGERLQDPIYTLKVKTGDCDDAILLYAALCESLRLPWKLVISGRDSKTRQKVRHIEGQRVPPNADWSHIYGIVGAPAFTPTEWWFAEPTIQGVPLGWDVISGDTKFLPEMGYARGGSTVHPSPKAGLTGRATLPPSGHQSPAWKTAYENLGAGQISALVGGLATADSVESAHTLSPSRVAVGILTGVGVAVGTQITMTLLSRLFPGILGSN